jgi:hypothetical protein
VLFLIFQLLLLVAAPGTATAFCFLQLDHFKGFLSGYRHSLVQTLPLSVGSVGGWLLLDKAPLFLGQWTALAREVFVTDFERLAGK